MKINDDLIANTVKKTGDTLTGELQFNNKNDYAAIRKTRTLNGTDYQAIVGLGSNGSARMQLMKGPNNVLSSVEAGSDGHIWNGQNSQRLGEVAHQQWGKSLTFSLEVGHHALVMINDTDCLMVWMSGGFGMRFARLYGSNVQVTSSGNTVTIKYSNDMNLTGNAIIT